MANRFVKVGGSNLLDGTTLANAWETAIYGFTNMGASNTLKFSAVGGSTFDIDRSSLQTPIPNGTSGSPSIITDNGDGAITFQRPASGSAGLLYLKNTPAKAYISFVGTSTDQLIFDMENQALGWATVYLGDPVSDNISFTNVDFRRCQNGFILGGNATNLTFDGCSFHDTTDPGATEPHAIYASGANLIVKNCVIYDIEGSGIHCYPSNTTGRQFFNNLIYDIGESGILIGAGDGQVYNNVIYSCGVNGVDIWRTTGVVVYHNSVHECGVDGISIGRSTGSTLSTLVKNNISLGNSGTAIRLYSSSSNAVVSWNNADAAVINGGSGTTLSNNATDTVAADEWVDPTNATLASRDYNLKLGADSIYNATTNAVPSVGVATDIAGTARNFIDQGAYAYGTTTPPDPPIISHPGSEIVTHEFTDVSLTLTKGTNNIVECIASGTGGKAALSAVPTNVTVVRN